MSGPARPARRPTRAMFFDVGGVLVDSPAAAFQAYELRAGLPAGALRALNMRDPGLVSGELGRRWARRRRRPGRA